MTNKHDEYSQNGHISKKLYEFLTSLYNLADINLNNSNKKIIDLEIEHIADIITFSQHSEWDLPRFFIGNYDVADVKLKAAIYYIRYCNIIDGIIEELDGGSKDYIITMNDYYIFDNSLKEINAIGISWYYDFKFRRSKATLFKGVNEISSWPIKRKEIIEQSGANAIKHIIANCREHINIGGNVQLCSYSKSFGLDLFKYISLHKVDEKSVSDVYVIKNADINVILNNKNMVSLQEFIYKNSKIDECNFAIDFSTSRDNKRENLYKWFKSFMAEKFAEKDKVESEEDVGISKYIQDNNLQDVKQIGKLVSPVLDKEVVASGDIWGPIVDYNESNIVYDEYGCIAYREEGKCIHFSFEENELYQLIYRYFELLALNKKNIESQSFEKKYTEVINQVMNMLGQKTVNGNKDNDGIKVLIKDKFVEIDKSLKISNVKIKALMSFIDWDIEESNIEWKYKTIYNKTNVNYFVNLFKLVMLDTYNPL